MNVTFSPAARDDLIEIALYIAQDNPSRALTFVDELEQRCSALGDAPGIGTARPELGEGIRVLPHGRYLIFYRQTPRSVRIERVSRATLRRMTWKRRLMKPEVEQREDESSPLNPSPHHGVAVGATEPWRPSQSGTSFCHLDASGRHPLCPAAGIPPTGDRHAPQSMERQA